MERKEQPFQSALNQLFHFSSSFTKIILPFCFWTISPTRQTCRALCYVPHPPHGARGQYLTHCTESVATESSAVLVQHDDPGIHSSIYWLRGSPGICSKGNSSPCRLFWSLRIKENLPIRGVACTGLEPPWHCHCAAAWDATEGSTGLRVGRLHLCWVSITSTEMNGKWNTNNWGCYRVFLKP